MLVKRIDGLWQVLITALLPTSMHELLTNSLIIGGSRGGGHFRHMPTPFGPGLGVAP